MKELGIKGSYLNSRKYKNDKPWPTLHSLSEKLKHPSKIRNETRVPTLSAIIL
jgi:hypothetical protein